MIKLRDCTTKIGSGVTPRGGHTAYKKTGVPLIRSMNVRLNAFTDEGLAFIDEEQDAAMAGSRVQQGDVLLNITGASIGRVCVAPSELCPANVNQHVCIIRSDGTLLPDWIAFFLAQPDLQKQILGQQSGATRQALTKEMIEAFDVPNPSPRDQERIASRLKEQIAAVEQARQQVLQQLKAIAPLRAKTLNDCFVELDATHGSQHCLGDVLMLRREVVHPRDKPKGAATFVGLEHVERDTGIRIGSVAVEMSKLTGRKPQFRSGDIVYGYLRPYLNKVWLADFNGLCSVDRVRRRNDVA